MQQFLKMHDNDFFAKTFHGGVEFQVCGGDRELKQGCKNSYYKVVNALMLGEVFDRHDVLHQFLLQTNLYTECIYRQGQWSLWRGEQSENDEMFKYNIVVLQSDSPHVYLKLRQNGQQKRRVFYLPHLNLSRNKSCFASTLRKINIGFWLEKNYTGVALYVGVTSLAAKQVFLGPVKRAICTDFLVKSRSTLCFQSITQGGCMAHLRGTNETCIILIFK